MPTDGIKQPLLCVVYVKYNLSNVVLNVQRVVFFFVGHTHSDLNKVCPTEKQHYNTSSESDVYEHQISTSKVDPRTERIKLCIIAVEP